MREIKFSDGLNEKGRNVEIVKVEVDETKLNFVDGYALAEAIVTKRNVETNEDFCYETLGVVDENFCEVKRVEDGRADLLSFTSSKGDIKRYSATDFIARVNFDNPKVSYGNFYHIRLVDGIPTLINFFGGVLADTHREEVKIVNNKRVYDVFLGKYVTREYCFLKEASVDKESNLKFDVLEIVQGWDLAKGILSNEVEYLRYTVDEKDQRISSIFSDLEGKEVLSSESAVDYDQFILQRRENLLRRYQESNVSHVDKTGNDESVLKKDFYDEMWY